jgi:predicted esterase
VQTELDKGIEPKRIVIAGFSQGGALAFHTALRSLHPIGGCIGLSTWVPFSADFPAALSPQISNLKILQVHGDEDSVVAHRWGEKSAKKLKEMFTVNPPQFLTIEGMGHSSDPEETREVQKFLKTLFEQ